MSVRVDLDRNAMRQWLQSDDMADMLTSYAQNSFKDYKVKKMGSRVAVFDDEDPQRLLRKAKRGSKR